MGKFAGATPLKTEKFSETWSALETALRDVPPETQVLTYCTGGIRCVKVNAYLKQRMGYHNVGMLHKGIIGYEKWLRDVNNGEGEVGEVEKDMSANEQVNNSRFTLDAGIDGHENPVAINKDDEKQKVVNSVFQGTNFVFDRRRLIPDSGNDN